MTKIFAFLFLMLSAFPVRAEKTDDGFYTRFDAGGVYSTQTSLKKGISVRAGVGQKWADMLRTELTVEYTRTVMRGRGSYDGRAVNVRTRLPSLAAMASAYVDLFEFKNVTPYIGAGAGVSRNALPDAVVDGRQVFGLTRFRTAWQVSGGIGIGLPENLVLDIGYAYTDLGKFSTKTSLPPVLTQDVKVRKINIGLRYNF